MNNSVKLLLLCPVVLTGCSAVDKTVDFFAGSDDPTEIETAVAETVADAAQSDTPETTLKENLIKDASDKLATETARMIDNTLGNSNTSITLTGVDKGNGRAEIKNVTGLDIGSNENRQTFAQGGLTSADKRTTLNIGVGQRYLSADEMSYTGVNAFLDYDADYGHQRASVGVEYKSSAFEITANSYSAITDWENGKNGNRERALDGYDVEIGGQIPYIPSGKLYVKSWKWDVPGSSSDIKGNTYSLAFSHLSETGLAIEVGRKDFDGLQTDENFIELTYGIKMGQPATAPSSSLISDKMFERTSMRTRLLEEVRRNNAIVIQTEFTAAVGGV